MFPPPPGAVAAEPPGLPPPGGVGHGRFSHPDGGGEIRLVRPARPAAEPVLLLMLHGCLQDPQALARASGMDAAAQARGWWLLYPAQPRAANAGGCWNWFDPAQRGRGRGEAAWLADLASAVAERAGVAPGRVVVAGFSAGAAMALALAAAYPERFAAVGAHSGLPPDSAHDLLSALAAMAQAAPDAGAAALPRPVIVFHGEADDTVHPGHGRRILRLRLAAGPAAAAASPGPAPDCERLDGEVPGGHRYVRCRYRRDDGGLLAEAWRVHGLGHAWSGGPAGEALADPAGPDASAEMLRFFAEVLGDASAPR
ncbi:extracellular catalytic domain type 1 short-chain-length polyhydroxyalkanoate depolymerase [Piscinibacter sakaiensis]|uniref:Poly(3-hydroxybutyrate) depolymerase n=1 Tax=Piscinibacter sakaiensis TaxID=1547922 RepID=A0A0K8P1M1_PISS1|nr:PHB depolymerase family esterase [Piscinibacter sakaiensis]GAP36070.1 poly(3-hydroxybutyrate) depolymerase [Piscinibacter sakaiensis]